MQAHLSNAGHVPYLETPQRFFSAVEKFLDGYWPRAAEKVTSLEPDDDWLSRVGA